MTRCCTYLSLLKLNTEWISFSSFRVVLDEEESTTGSDSNGSQPIQMIFYIMYVGVSERDTQ